MGNPTTFGIPTMYNGRIYKSRLEADTAYLLDGLGHRWDYEPQSFLLPGGEHYWPDFYVHDLGLWIETRGYDKPKGRRQIEAFASLITEGVTGIQMQTLAIYQDDEEDHIERQIRKTSDYLVIGPEHCTLYECTHRYGVDYSDDVWLTQCGGCQRWFFAGRDGSYQCRACGLWDGRKHLRCITELTLTGGAICLSGGLVINTIAEWLKAAAGNNSSRR